MEAIREIRTIMGRGLGVDDAKRSVFGIAAPFGVESDPIGGENGFIEEIAPGAFAQSLLEKDDVVGLLNHNNDNLLGRVSADTLRLREVDTGLAFTLLMPDTVLGRDVFELVKRRDLNGCSFSFSARSDSWPSSDKRILRNVKLYDISLATFPAYPRGTDAHVGMLTDAGRQGRGQKHDPNTYGVYRMRRDESSGLHVPVQDEADEDRRRVARAKLAGMEL